MAITEKNMLKSFKIITYFVKKDVKFTYLKKELRILVDYYVRYYFKYKIQIFM